MKYGETYLMQHNCAYMRLFFDLFRFDSEFWLFSILKHYLINNYADVALVTKCHVSFIVLWTDFQYHL